ncbi:serine/threonine protein kinase [Stanieria sp. NIES-3757]|nr:serine/threonine protein kinase [Stanieria sp. NIES-3757]
MENRHFHYEILRQIGQGQFSKVFCAINRQTGQLVALKELNCQNFSTKLFLRELNFLVSLHHPNIVTFQGLEYISNNRYLVMDYCEGGTLRDLIEYQVSISTLDILKFINDILLGLEYAHSREVVHCDLKPENVLLEPQGNSWIARISDFGIARLLQEAGVSIVGLGATGSPAYMAPERFYGRYSVASDLYAVGIILYELLLGTRPFDGVPGDLIKAHLNQTITIPDSVPFILHSTIIKALQKLPQRRFTSAAEMRKSIQLAREILFHL